MDVEPGDQSNGKLTKKRNMPVKTLNTQLEVCTEIDFTVETTEPRHGGPSFVSSTASHKCNSCGYRAKSYDILVIHLAKKILAGLCPGTEIYEL